MRTNFIKEIKEKVMRTKFIKEKFMKKTIGVFAVSAMLGLMLTCENTLYKNEAKKAAPKTTEEEETGGGYYIPPTVLPTKTIYTKVIKGKTDDGKEVVLKLTTETPPTTKSVNTLQNASGVMFDIVSPSKGEEFDYTLAVDGTTISKGKVTVKDDNLTWEFKPAAEYIPSNVDGEYSLTATVGGGNLKFSEPIPTGKTTIGEDGEEIPETITIGELDVEGGLWLGNGDDEEEEVPSGTKTPLVRKITDDEGKYVLTLIEILDDAAQNISGAMFSVNRPVLNEKFNYKFVNTFDDPNKIINHGTVTIENYTKWTFTPAVVGEPFAASVVGGYLEFDADAVIYDESEVPEGEVGENVDNSSPTIIIIPKLGGGNVLAAVDEKDEDEEVKIIKVTSLTLNKTALTMEKGGTETLTATVVTEPEDAEVEIWWGSSKASAVSVEDGVVTAHKGGSAVIKAMAGTVMAECVVTVPLDAGLYIGESSDPVDLSLAEGETVTIAKALAWINTNGVNDGQYRILLGADETDETATGFEIKGASDKKNMVIILRGLSTDPENPVTITKNAAGPLFTVDGSTATNDDDVPELILENITLKGLESNDSALVVVGKSYDGTNHYRGKLTMKEGSRITGNTTSAGAGGISVLNGSLLTMKDGRIDNNTATGGSSAGGVSALGSFTMDGGSIDNNKGTATSARGGVTVSGTFIMTGGVIEKNEAGTPTSGGGGGVSVSGTGTFEMSGGIIRNNKGVTYAGGVYVNSSSGATFAMSGSAVISGNEALGTNGRGGGVLIGHASIKFTMTGGSIEGNKAVNGAAIYVVTSTSTPDTFIKSGGTVYGKEAAAGDKANVPTNGYVITTSAPIRWRDTTAGPGVSLDSDSDENWGE